MTRLRIIPVMTLGRNPGRIVTRRPSRRLYCDRSFAKTMLRWLEAKWLPGHARKMRHRGNIEHDGNAISMRSRSGCATDDD